MVIASVCWFSAIVLMFLTALEVMSTPQESSTEPYMILSLVSLELFLDCVVREYLLFS